MAPRSHCAPPRRGALLVELLAALTVVAVVGTLGLQLASQQLLLHDRALTLHRGILAVDAPIEAHRNRPCSGTLPPLPPPPRETHLATTVTPAPPASTTLARVRTTLQWTPRHGGTPRPLLEADAQVLCW